MCRLGAELLPHLLNEIRGMKDKQTLLSSDCLMAYSGMQDYDIQKVKVGLQCAGSTLRADCQLSALGMRATSLYLSENLEK